MSAPTITDSQYRTHTSEHGTVDVYRKNLATRNMSIEEWCLVVMTILS